MKLSLGFSPCPNDTFIFDALVNGKIDTQGLEFEVTLADVEELNHKAFNQELDITKLSYHAFAFLSSSYNLLNSGSALGNNCGPLLVALKPYTKEDLSTASVAIPGEMTTANFLLHFYSNSISKKHVLLFSSIEEAVLSGKMDAGVIIHENRFTYAERGLLKVVDLGEYWEEETGYPIPLGGIAAHTRLPHKIQRTFNTVLKNSIEYAFENSEYLSKYVKEHAQEMDDSVMRKHIDLYVNQFTMSLGDSGKAAIQKLFKTLGKEDNFIIIQ